MSESIYLSQLNTLHLVLAVALLGCSGSLSSPSCDSSNTANSVGDGPCMATGGTSSGGTASLGGTSQRGGSAGLGGTSAMPVLDFKCAKDSDCCIVADGCMALAYLVTKSQEAELAAYLASNPHTTCLACMSPAVQVSCQNGMCAGEKIGYAYNGLEAFGATHCGKLPLPATGGSNSVAVAALVSAASGGANAATGGTSSTAPSKTTFGCGS